MQCRTCGYPLWKLSTPQCPECGDPFDWRSYRFHPGTVGLACPHCGRVFQKREIQSARRQLGYRGDSDGFQEPPATATGIACPGCGAAVSARALQVVPLTADPRKAEALADIPVPPYAASSRTGIFCIVLLVLELPAALLPFLSFAEKTSPLDAVMGEWRFQYWRSGLPFFLGIFATLGLWRSFLPARWTPVEIAAGYLAAIVGLLVPASLAAQLSVEVFNHADGLNVQACIILGSFWFSFIGVIVLAVVHWCCRVPHAVLVQLCLRAAWIPNAAMCVVWFREGAFLSPEPDIGWWVTIYVLAVYLIALSVVSVVIWKSRPCLAATSRDW